MFLFVLEEIEDTKKTFQNYLTFSSQRDAARCLDRQKAEVEKEVRLSICLVLKSGKLPLFLLHSALPVNYLFVIENKRLGSQALMDLQSYKAAVVLAIYEYQMVCVIPCQLPFPIRGAAHTDFGRSVNPISTRRVQIMPT